MKIILINTILLCYVCYANANWEIFGFENSSRNEKIQETTQEPGDVESKSETESVETTLKPTDDESSQIYDATNNTQWWTKSSSTSATCPIKMNPEPKDYFVGEPSDYFEIESLENNPLKKWLGVYNFPNRTLIVIKSTNDSKLVLRGKRDLCYNDDKIEMVFDPLTFSDVLHHLSHPCTKNTYQKPYDLRDLIRIHDRDGSHHVPKFGYILDRNTEAILPFHIVIKCMEPIKQIKVMTGIASDYFTQRIYKRTFLYLDELEYRFLLSKANHIQRIVGESVHYSVHLERPIYSSNKPLTQI